MVDAAGVLGGHRMYTGSALGWLVLGWVVLCGVVLSGVVTPGMFNTVPIDLREDANRQLEVTLFGEACIPLDAYDKTHAVAVNCFERTMVCLEFRSLLAAAL